MNEVTTARGEGRKRLGRIPEEDAHCQTINSKMGTTQLSGPVKEIATLLGQATRFVKPQVTPRQGLQNKIQVRHTPKTCLLSLSETRVPPECPAFQKCAILSRHKKGQGCKFSKKRS
jgi:hypothetical protein